MSPSSLALSAATLVGFVLLMSVWDESTTWRHWSLVLILVIAALVFRSVEYNAGYDDGAHDTACRINQEGC